MGGVWVQFVDEAARLLPLQKLHAWQDSRMTGLRPRRERAAQSFLARSFVNATIALPMAGMFGVQAVLLRRLAAA